MKQLSLLDVQTAGAPYQRTSETSVLAAISIREHVGPMQQRVLDYICGMGPSTEEEISLGAGMRLSSVCARVNELVHQKGYLADSGLKRRTSSGRLAVVWHISPSPLTNRRGEKQAKGGGFIESKA